MKKRIIPNPNQSAAATTMPGSHRRRAFIILFIIGVATAVGGYIGRDSLKDAIAAFLYDGSRADWELFQLRRSFMKAEFQDSDAAMREKCFEIARANPGARTEVTAYVFVAKQWPETADAEAAHAELLRTAKTVRMDDLARSFQDLRPGNGERWHPLAALLIERVRQAPDHPKAARLLSALHGYHENSTRTVEVLRQFGANLAAPSPLHGYSALHLAAIPNMQRVVRWLVENGIDVDIRSEKTKTPCDWSQLMDTSPFHPFDGSNATPLMIACGEGHFDMANALIQLGADVSAQDSSGHAPLHYAAGGYWTNRQQDYAGIVELLRQYGASPNIRDQQGRRPVDLAHMKDYGSITTLLERSA